MANAMAMLGAHLNKKTHRKMRIKNKNRSIKI
nr:MAG TPA: hypothetical protein [Siphoviridae sp. ct6ap5]